MKKYFFLFTLLLLLAVGGYAAYCHWMRPTRILIVNALKAQQADFTLNNDSRHIEVECVEMVMHMNMSEIFGKEDFTIVKNPGQDNMEIIQKKGRETLRPTRPVARPLTERGRRVGDWALPTSWRTDRLFTCQMNNEAEYLQ